MIEQDIGVTQSRPVCEACESSLHARIDGHRYFRCNTCGSLHIDRTILDAIDAGRGTRIYDAGNLEEELHAARERAQGVSLVRAGEANLYARRPVQRFLDVGTGPGYLLDALAKVLPVHAQVFHGVERFPPEAQSRHPSYWVGESHDLDGVFDAGTCIEMVEHLTPRMLRRLAEGLAGISRFGSLWLFNPGSPEYVLREDPGYLDPVRRCHIVAYGMRGICHLFEPVGFRFSVIPGKSYVWIAEFLPTEVPDFSDRVYRPLADNRALPEESGHLYQAAFESARASRYQQLPARPGSTDASMSPDAWNEYHFMLHSRSWRLTQPLRNAARRARAWCAPAHRDH